jgi:hypothetical protein
MTSKISAGTRLRSQVCPAEVVVVRGGTGDVRLTCGGVPMVPPGTGPAQGGGVPTVPPGADPAPAASPASGLMDGAVLGKRYTASQDDTFEVLVTRPGRGTLADGTEPLVIKAPKALPASD